MSEDHQDFMRPGRRLPALSVLPGAPPAQDATRVAEPQRRIAVPIAAVMARAVLAWMPGRLGSCASCEAKGAGA
jgi:hypothetical protein